MSDLLPPNANAHEHALDDAAARLGAVPVEIAKLWSAGICPAALLPWLAWALSVDEWDETWNEAQKRAAVAASYHVHAYKGTPYAIKTALAALGYDNITIRECRTIYYDAELNHDAAWHYGGDGFWPLFDVILNVGLIPDAGMVQKIRDRIERYKNARSQLRNLIFMNLLYNDTVIYDNTYMHNGGIV